MYLRTTRRRARVAGLVLTAAATAAVVTAPALASPAHVDGSQADRATVVLVHGAWADSGTWNRVIARLGHDGYPVRAFATPLASLSGDSGALRDFLQTVPGPVVLVGHSYGGAVITSAATGLANVKALVYIDAFAPDQGEAVINLAGSDSAIADPAAFDLVPAAAPTPRTELYVTHDVFVRSLANDVPRRTAAALYATQRPVTYGALTEPTGSPAWAGIPSWYEIGTIDKIITPDQQLAMARTAHAHVGTARTGHLPMVSDPRAVTDTIERAARATT